VVEKKPVGAGQPKIMKIMNDRNAQREGRVVHGRGQAWQGILDHPKIELFPGMQRPELPFHPGVVPSPKGHGKGIRGPRSPESLGGAKVIFHPVGGRKGGGKKFRKPFLSARLKIATEDLKDTQIPHV
jgi:hypothetical protein